MQCGLNADHFYVKTGDIYKVVMALHTEYIVHT